jgi:hypothetical protein
VAQIGPHHRFPPLLSSLLKEEHTNRAHPPTPACSRHECVAAVSSRRTPIAVTVRQRCSPSFGGPPD